MGGVLHRLAGRPTAVAGGLLVGGWILVALFANLIAPYDPLHSIQPLVPPGGFDAIGGSHWLGTDYLGRDILSRLVVGARSVILLATAATLTAYCVGIAGGLAAGYFRGWTDSALSFLSNVVLSFPILVLYIVVIVAIGASAANVILAVTFGSAPAIFRIVRTITMDIASRDFVAASVIQGETVLRILAVDILPNATGPLVVDFCLRLGYTAITIGALGFLGLGLPPPTPDWGGMVNEGRTLAFAYPYLVLFPCLAISSLVLGLSLLADGLRGGDGATMKPAILEVTGLSVSLPAGADRPYAVANASFELRRGEILCVVGESGSGKSVLSSAIMGAPAKGLKIVAGSIKLGGQELTGLSDRALQKIRGNRIAMIFQEPMAALNPSFRVGRQVEEVFELHGSFSAPERRERTLQLLTEMQLPNPERIANAYPHQLSGGQCQRVIIAMALAMQPEVLIADEPTTALDVTTQAQVLRLVRELRDKHDHGILFITHDFGVVADIADRIAVINKGEIVEIGEAAQVLKSPQHPYTQGLIAAVPSLEPPRRGTAIERRGGVQTLTVDRLTKRYAGVTALDDVSLKLERGEIVTIVGESGCGKSTLARVIVRLTKPSEGTVAVEDAAPGRSKTRREDRRQVQMIFQDPFGSLNPRRAVGDIIARAAMLGGADAKTARTRARALLTQVGLTREAYSRRPRAFSGGQRQRIGIARALAMEPAFVIADESVSALDVSIQAQILDLLRKLQTELGLGILFITHDLRVAAQLSDRILVMKGGKVIEHGTAETLLNAPVDPYTRRLFEAAPGRGVV